MSKAPILPPTYHTEDLSDTDKLTIKERIKDLQSMIISLRNIEHLSSEIFIEDIKRRRQVVGELIEECECHQTKLALLDIRLHGGVDNPVALRMECVISNYLKRIKESKAKLERCREEFRKKHTQSLGELDNLRQELRELRE